MIESIVPRESRSLLSWPFSERFQFPEFGDLWKRLEEENGFHFAPFLDVSETDSDVQIKADLPGMAVKDIDVEIDGNTLTLRGERQEKKEEKKRNYHRIERRTGSFARTITLPCAVDEGKVAAEYKEGVLTVTLPKTEQSRSKRIPIKG